LNWMSRPGAMIGALLMIASVSACASTDTRQPQVPVATGAADTAGAATAGESFPEGFEIGQLPAQKLEPGECGLFLFMARPTPRFVFFANAAKGSALMNLDGDFVTLARTETSGEVFDQQYSQQSFVAPAQGLAASLSVLRGRETRGGSQIDGGSLRLSRDNGWNMVVPVSGATACVNR
jgi:hypothetical protein